MRAMVLGCMLIDLLLFLLVVLACVSRSNQSSIHSFVECLSTRSPSPVKIYTQNTTTYHGIYMANSQNPRVLESSSSRTPLFIVVPSQEVHVQATVICCRRNGIELRVRSGGHDYEGLSYVSDHTSFVMLDLSDFNSINVNLTDNTVWVQAGAILEKLYDKIAQQDSTKGFPAGLCPKVGVGGHFSGGGIGPLMRIYGLAADNILDAHIVDSNGRLLNRRSMGEDLYWAIRGGGAASYGVVLSYKIMLVNVPPKVTIFSIVRSLEQGAVELIGKWQEVAATIDKKLYINIIFETAGFDENRAVKAIFESIYQGPIMDLLPLLEEAFPELGVTSQDCTEITYNEAVQHFGAASSFISGQVKPPFKAKSDFVKTPLPKTAFEGLSKLMMENVAGLLFMEPFGGKMDEIEETEIPFPHRRGNLFIIQYFVITQQESDQDWIDRLYTYMTPYVSQFPRSAYLNYRDLDLGRTEKNTPYWEARTTWGSKYFKGNFERLALAKSQTDRSNFFRNEQSIPPFNLSYVRAE